MMSSISKLGLWAVLFSFIFFAACNDDDIDIPVEEELITTLKAQLTPNGGGDVVNLTFVDFDGDGGNAPIITGGTLSANTVYTMSLVLLNESENPAEDITIEIAEEDDEHQFFFSASSALNLVVAYADQDGNGQPLGLLSTITAGGASNGTLTITLRHEPNKSAAGVSDGDISNAGGETDIEVLFPITIVQ